jgi:glycerol-3-phosphate dehydrogenase (NAD(P)+)
MSDEMSITVLGAGSWGTTLAILLDENNHRVVLWEFFPEVAHAVR